MSTSTADAWSKLRRFTPARIALGRAGDGLPTAPLLDFQAAHAAARDAVWASLDVEALSVSLKADLPDQPLIRAHSQAADRTVFLKRPDLGRLLDPDSVRALPKAEGEVVFVLADGLSATALQAHGILTLKSAIAAMEGIKLGPVIIAEQARVGLTDAVGEAMDARMIVMLVGERPGLSAADSLGAYLTFAPKVGLQNANRNCVSNIRDGGLPPSDAGSKIGWLVREALKLGLTGIKLKDRSSEALGHNLDQEKRIEG